MVKQFDRALFAARLRSARAYRGMKLRQVQAVAATSYTTLWRWENNGPVPTSIDNLRALSRALNVTSDWLLGLSDEGGPE